jgi:hypothetical protein
MFLGDVWIRTRRAAVASMARYQLLYFENKCKASNVTKVNIKPVKSEPVIFTWLSESGIRSNENDKKIILIFQFQTGFYQPTSGYQYALETISSLKVHFNTNSINVTVQV